MLDMPDRGEKQADKYSIKKKKSLAIILCYNQNPVEQGRQSYSAYSTKFCKMLILQPVFCTFLLKCLIHYLHAFTS